MAEPSLYWRHREELLNRPLFMWPGLSAWAFYFIAKVILAFRGYLEIGLWENLAMMMLLTLPMRTTALKWLRQIVAIPVGLGLLYHESSLPPFSSIIDQWSSITGFSFAYMWELLTRSIQVEFIIVLLIAWIGFVYLQNIVRMTVIAFIAVIAAGVAQQPAETPLQAVPTTLDLTTIDTPDAIQFNSPSEKLEAFYDEQQKFKLTPSRESTADFDILLINICSMSWQDLATAGLQDHPVIKDAHLMFENYNSATSYSGPSALRLLRANCGHQPHQQLFTNTPQCMVSQQLEKLGYRPEVLLNHTGEYDDFSGLLQQFAGMPAPQFNTSAPISMTGFDGSLIKSDSAILQNWLASSTNSDSRFTFYNTLSLHDGNRVPGFNGNSLDSYAMRTATLLDEIYQLQMAIKASGRRVLLIIAPEHGANLKGDALQLPGLREIPTPPITHVPVLISLFGEGFEAPQEQLVVERNTGPTAITSAIFEINAQQPFSNPSFSLTKVAEQLPSTEWVAENKDIKVIDYKNNFWLKIKERNWLPYKQ
ncbi:cellulose biosynthesis protein BcsG [Pseudidiomarina aquimaris]|uniref:Cellulose biosynthesis protein BcsG n=1 Tax=Pseudidiomarina aquimaris TaxID=641841 RepID=A0A432XPE8_9GAMM|nr:cellulose biosynthesis protein BcsG [Pseudidiomarina aquimaris]RUO50608.1 cellulose biosynthesis protein BcsG [Pseudidiomarina aquimaris]